MTEHLLDPTTEEQHLLNSAKTGSKVAFNKLYDRYAPALFGIITDLTDCDTSLSEQLLHASFCAIWQNIKKHDPAKKRLFTWMTCITRTLTLETLAKKGIKIQKKGIFVNKSVKTARKTNKLPKSALELMYFNGYTLEEAAKKLDICTKDLKLRLRQELNSHRQTGVNEKY